MSVSGLCELCTQNEIVDGCERCGRLVCERHYAEVSGLCTDCHNEVEPTDGDPRRPDGVDTYQV